MTILCALIRAEIWRVLVSFSPHLLKPGLLWPTYLLLDHSIDDLLIHLRLTYVVGLFAKRPVLSTIYLSPPYFLVIPSLL